MTVHPSDHETPDLGKTMPPTIPETPSILALRRGLAVLDAFSAGPAELGVNELGRMTGVHKSTVSRLCVTLEQAGYLARDPSTEKYRLGMRIRQLSAASPHEVELRTAARDVLHRLVETSGETVTMVVREGLDVTTIEVIEGPSMVRIQTRVGARAQIHASAGAKAILAWLPADELGRVIDGWPRARLTVNTITDKQALIDHLALVREQGYSVDNEELEIGLRCVGAPVRDQSGEVVAAVAVSGPRFRVLEEDANRIGLMVRQAADSISARLGAPASALAPSAGSAASRTPVAAAVGRASRP
jgi:IclR family KDG regulon transcriptional repressor